MNRLVLIIVVILVILVGGYFLLRGGYQAPAPTPTTAPTVTPVAPAEAPSIPVPSPTVREITVIGSEFSLSPSSISVKAGEKIKIVFKNEGKAVHNLTVEALGVGTKTIGGGQKDTIEFEASASGTYAFFCSVPGHRAAGMEGSLKVQ